MTVKLTDLKIKNLIPEDKKYKVRDAVVSGMYVLVRPSGSRMFVHTAVMKKLQQKLS